jgi:prepilin-type N-terminal cleavage/methylation domain-containing protein
MRRSEGFTLVELLVVLAIIAIVALVGMPWLIKIGQRSQLRSAASEIQTTLLAARIKAVKRNQPVNIMITPGPPIVLMTVEAPVPTPNPTLVPQQLQLPPKSAFLYATPRIAGGTVSFGGDGRLAMPTPNPTPGAYEYVIRGPVGVPTPNEIHVQAWPNGRVVVVTPKDWY